MPDQSSNSTGQVGARVPTNIKSASNDWADYLNYQRREETIKVSHLFRQAWYEFMLNHWDEAPEDVRENVDREWLQSQTDGGVGVEL